MQTGIDTMESSMEISQKVKNGSTFDPAIPLLRIYLKEPKTLIQKNISTPNVHFSIIYNCQDMEAVRCLSINEWIKHLWDIYTMEYYLAIKKK